MSRVKCSAGRFGWVVVVLLCLPDRAASFDLTPFVGPLPLGDQMIGHPHQLREADFNRDGILDFVISGDSGVVLLVNSGTNPPAITEARTLVSGVFSNLYGWYSIGDLDGDQWPDVIVASNHSDQLLWYRNSGAYPASFEAHVIDTAPGTDNLGPRAAEVGDIDGDDDLDIVCAIYGFLPARSGSPSGEVVWYENVAGDGSQWTKHTIEEIDLPEQIFVNDIDGDGDPDIFVGLHSRALVWYMNPGAPFDFKRRAVGPYGRPFDWTKFADLNGDGRTDIVTTITTGITWVENGGGTPTQWFPHLAYAIPAQTLDVGDLDGDGDSDIVITDEYYAKVAWYESTGGPLPSFPVEHSLTAYRDNLPLAAAVAARDLDRDGDLDLFLFGESGTPGPVPLWYRNAAGLNVSSATFEDLSGDGVNLVGEPGTLHVRLLAQTRQTLMNAAVLVSSETPGLEFMPTRFELGTVEAATTQSADFQYTTSGATCGDELRAALSVVWDGNFSEAAAGPEPFGQIRPFSFAAEESPGVAIPDADPAGVTRSLAVGAMPGHTVETVDVTVDITHPYVADLQIDLVGPDDELVNLFTGGNADNHADLHRTFTLTRYQGQEADGTYQLTVRDRVAEDAGTLDHWGVTLHTTARVCDPWSVEQLILELLGIDAGATETDINKDGRFDVADVLALMSTIPRPTELSDRDR